MQKSIGVKVLHRFNPERAHTFSLHALKIAAANPVASKVMEKKYIVDDERLEQRVLGTIFSNPVGLAAGYDKNAVVINGARLLGFGFTEVGGITPKPQYGNTKPRLFRFNEQESLQNAMGFNNDGLDVIKSRVEMLHPFQIPIGINVAKNKDTPLDKALDDYIAVIKGFGDNCDYFVINVSSPNTKGLRDLQNEQFLEQVIGNGKRYTTRPILVKISPDLEFERAITLCKAAVEKGASGIIATNTTTDYTLLDGARETGGISGKALRVKSFLLFKHIAKELFGKTTLISVGGIDSPEEALKRIRHGASLVQFYSGLVFKGPSLASYINKELLTTLRKERLDNIKEIVGSAL
ncbi:MAG: dihydroorotate dehydrogenase (quinone) [Candidatus Micrarchaeales archaeon]